MSVMSARLGLTCCEKQVLSVPCAAGAHMQVGFLDDVSETGNRHGSTPLRLHLTSTLMCWLFAPLPESRTSLLTPSVCQHHTL